MIIKLFKQITKIPRCSKIYKPFINFIESYAIKYNYICKVDEANNILCYKQNSTSTVCLQSHYDIVCLKKDTIPIVIEENNFLYAKDSTLGADNGIGCAYMLALMYQDIDCEFLFTSDEEIGLIGANNISFDLKSKNMLNLDSESIGEICIGCAGGLDIFATTTKYHLSKNETNKTLYEVTISGLDGGHSGVDIDKNIPNAIKLLVDVIDSCKNIDLIDINGGERINSIPKYAKAIIASSTKPIIQNKYTSIIKIDDTSQHYKVLDKNIVTFISNFNNGILKQDKNLNIVVDSINLAIITTNVDNVKISFSARSIDNDNLNNIAIKIINELQKYNFKITTDGKYPAWKPNNNHFTSRVLTSYKKYFNDVKLGVIHAGLECAIFKEKYPNLNIASIGPNIHFPHSNKERCDINSINKVYEILKDIIK